MDPSARRENDQVLPPFRHAPRLSWWTSLTSVERVVLVAILLIGAALRIHWNNVAEYSAADEKLYVEYTRYLREVGWINYPTLVRHHIETATNWQFPSPMRWGYLALSTAACALRGECDYRTLAWLSTAAGVAAIFLTYLVGVELLGARPALLGAALSITSPLQLALGRRALQDEVFCAVVLAALWAWLRALRAGDGERRTWTYTLAIGIATLGFAVKETFITLYPALLVFLWPRVRERGLKLGDVLLLLAPPFLFVFEFCLLTRGVSDFLRLFHIMRSMHIDYVALYQGGPPHRPLFDLFLLAPLVCLLAAGAVVIVSSRVIGSEAGVRRLVLVTVITLVIYALLSKNVRFVVMVDPMLRLLAGWVVVKHLLGPGRFGLTGLVGVAIVNGVVEIFLFHTVFIVHKVYDPVTANLLRALNAIP